MIFYTIIEYALFVRFLATLTCVYYTFRNMHFDFWYGRSSTIRINNKHCIEHFVFDFQWWLWQWMTTFGNHRQAFGGFCQSLEYWQSLRALDHVNFRSIQTLLTKYLFSKCKRIPFNFEWSYFHFEKYYITSNGYWWYQLHTGPIEAI